MEIYGGKGLWHGEVIERSSKGHNPVGVEFWCGPCPMVGPVDQPWALLQNPFGIKIPPNPLGLDFGAVRVPGYAMRPTLGLVTESSWDKDSLNSTRLRRNNRFRYQERRPISGRGGAHTLLYPDGIPSQSPRVGLRHDDLPREWACPQIPTPTGLCPLRACYFEAVGGASRRTMRKPTLNTR